MACAFRHFGIVVNDLEKMKDFYTRVLHFSLVKEAEEVREFIDPLLGLKGSRLRTVKLSFPDGQGILELLKFCCPHSDRPSRSISSPGISHFALSVDDLSHMFQYLSKEGVKFLSDPLVSPDKKAKVAFCLDPEGIPIELVESLSP
jgi:catechol 2,3-dioxygenase-like lactoylglutathione lyase family enzyme